MVEINILFLYFKYKNCYNRKYFLIDQCNFLTYTNVYIKAGFLNLIQCVPSSLLAYYESGKKRFKIVSVPHFYLNAKLEFWKMRLLLFSSYEILRQMKLKKIHKLFALYANSNPLLKTWTDDKWCYKKRKRIWEKGEIRLTNKSIFPFPTLNWMMAVSRKIFIRKSNSWNISISCWVDFIIIWNWNILQIFLFFF